eukprot:jgi/Mesen1/177/ME1135209C07654
MRQEARSSSDLMLSVKPSAPAPRRPNGATSSHSGGRGLRARATESSASSSSSSSSDDDSSSKATQPPGVAGSPAASSEHLEPQAEGGGSSVQRGGGKEQAARAPSVSSLADDLARLLEGHSQAEVQEALRIALSKSPTRLGGGAPPQQGVGVRQVAAPGSDVSDPAPRKEALAGGKGLPPSQASRPRHHHQKKQKQQQQQEEVAEEAEAEEEEAKEEKEEEK